MEEETRKRIDYHKKEQFNTRLSAEVKELLAELKEQYAQELQMEMNTSQTLEKIIRDTVQQRNKPAA